MQLHYNKQPINVTIELPGSKSISNRLLILNEVLGINSQFKNLSTAKDTQDLVKAISQIKDRKNNIIDVGHAGTDMRFLTTLLSITPGEWILTGSDRMKERPIKELVNVLKKLGADISYQEKDGFPPLKITGEKLSGNKIEIDGSISSQFISALLLIAPALENGLEIEVKNKIVSWPYIQMTLDLLSEAGAKVSTNLNTISVKPNTKPEARNNEYIIESDWSSASYWFSMVALAFEAKVVLKGLNEKTSQGDIVVRKIYEQLGVSSIFENGHLVLMKIPVATRHFEYDFTDCPDLAQTIAVTCFGLNITCKLSGLSTLKNKETDRIIALKTELEKMGAKITTTFDSLQIINPKPEIANPKSEISTYTDHRMAMSFAPLALILDLEIEDHMVVEKSYPHFWEHLQLAGIHIS